MNSICVNVPATTANVGPGFDCLGAALSLYNSFIFTPLESGEPYQISVRGREAARVKTDASNLVYQVFCKFFQHLGQTPALVQIDIDLQVPLARGLGSSATAIVAGLVGANALAGSPLSKVELLQMAIAIEGHPDNVVPALLGGCQLTAIANQSDWEICPIPWCDRVVPVVAIPDFELSTQEARQVLPDRYSRADAIFNAAHLGLLLRGLETGEEDWLRAALQDRIHQPYRKSLIPGYEAVGAAAIAAGAYGIVISGAGPSLLALTGQEQAVAVQSAMATEWQSLGMEAQVKILRLVEKGTTVEPLTRSESGDRAPVRLSEDSAPTG